MKQHRRLAAIMGMIAAAGMVTQARAQSVKQEDPIPDSAAKSLVAIEKTFVTIPTAEPMMLFPQMREQLKDAPPFLRDSTAAFNVRSYYRDNVSNAPSGAKWNEAWAAGGSVAFETGRLFDLILGGLRPLYVAFPALCAARP